MCLPKPPTPDVSCPEPDDDLALRAVLANARRGTDERRAERAFLQATRDLSVCSTAAWERARQNGTTAEQLFVEAPEDTLPAPRDTRARRFAPVPLLEEAWAHSSITSRGKRSSSAARPSTASSRTT